MLEFTDKVVGKIKYEKDVTEEEIANVIITALEGGCNYWAGLDDSKPGWNYKPIGEPKSTWATKLILEGKSITLYDVEEEDDDWVLTLENLLQGLSLNARRRSHDCDLDNMDGVTADCIIQYALFGEIVYG
jgi:hypothetical protein